MSDQINFKFEDCNESEREKCNIIFDEYYFENIKTIDNEKEKFAIKVYDKDLFFGALMAKISHGAVHVSLLVVDKNYRGKGFGKKLLSQAEEYAIKKGARFATLETRSYQAPDFYESQGYKVDFIREGYINNTSKIYLSKALDQ